MGGIVGLLSRTETTPGRFRDIGIPYIKGKLQKSGKASGRKGKGVTKGLNHYPKRRPPFVAEVVIKGDVGLVRRPLGSCASPSQSLLGSI